MAIKPFNSVAGFSVGEIPANVILANGDIITGNITANANITITPGGFFLGDGSKLTGIDTTNIKNGNSNVSIPTANGNVTTTAGGNTTMTVTSTGANITGTLSASGDLTSLNANLGNLATANFFTGVLTTNAQPNITTVGTLANLTVGNATENTVFGNGTITATGVIIGNGSGLTSLTGGNVTGQVANALVAGTVYANAQPNITSVGSLSALTVSGTSNLGAITNVKVSGGSTGQVVSTDGAGNLSFVTISTSSITNGNSSVNVAANSDVTVEANGINVITISGFGGNASNNITTIDGSLTATGNITAPYFIGNVEGPISGNIVIPGANTGVVFNDAGNANSSTAFTFNKTSNVVTVTGNLSISDTSTLPNIVGALITTASNANLNIEPNGTGVVVIANTAGGATAIAMGDPTLGNLVSNAVTLSNSSSVSNAVAQLNFVLGKLIPASPPNFPASQSIVIADKSTYRMTTGTQTDNTPGANKAVAAGNTVTSVRRAATYSTNSITTAGPGDSGTISVQVNGANAGGRTLTTSLDGNGTYSNLAYIPNSNLTIFNNFDYGNANASIAKGFWSVFSANASGTVNEGWNEVYIADSAASNTNTANWFYDSSTPGTPTFSTLAITAPTSPSYTYSSTVPHYNSTNIFNITFNVNRLSGNMYPTSDTFVTSTKIINTSFEAPANVTYANAGISTPLAQNLFVASGNASVSTTSAIVPGFGASPTGPSITVNNSYNTNTASFTTALAANVLYKTGTTSSATRIEEANVFVGSSFGSGTGEAVRIVNPGSANTPAFTASAAAFNSQSSTLQTYDATVVANILKHDQTNYSTGYLPVGPDLSSGRSGTQYFTFKVVRQSVSKFDIKWSGTIAGLWVALPGSTIDTTSGANGWLSMSTAYGGAGIPGANSPGNGSDGCALGGLAPLGTPQSNKSVTATFGTVSSSSTITNEIYIRIALTSGQSVTALSLQTASN